MPTIQPATTFDHAPLDHPPPPYMRIGLHGIEHQDHDSDDSEDDDDTQAIKIHINSTKSIRGSNNLVQVDSPTYNHVFDGTHCANIMLHALKHFIPSSTDTSASRSGQPQTPPQPSRPGHHLDAHTPQPPQNHPQQPHPVQNHLNVNTPQPPQSRCRRCVPRKLPSIHITVNCGTNIVGDRNVVTKGGSGPGVANVAIRPAVPGAVRPIPVVPGQQPGAGQQAGLSQQQQPQQQQGQQLHGERRMHSTQQTNGEVSRLDTNKVGTMVAGIKRVANGAEGARDEEGRQTTHADGEVDGEEHTEGDETIKRETKRLKTKESDEHEG